MDFLPSMRSALSGPTDFVSNLSIVSCCQSPAKFFYFVFHFFNDACSRITLDPCSAITRFDGLRKGGLLLHFFGCFWLHNVIIHPCLDRRGCPQLLVTFQIAVSWIATRVTCWFPAIVDCLASILDASTRSLVACFIKGEITVGM
jgi:hypothetical protein